MIPSGAAAESAAAMWALSHAWAETACFASLSQGSHYVVALLNGPGLVVHSTRTDERPYDVAGLPVTSLHEALVGSWGLLNRRAAEPGLLCVA